VIKYFSPPKDGASYVSVYQLKELSASCD